MEDIVAIYARAAAGECGPASDFLGRQGGPVSSEQVTIEPRPRGVERPFERRDRARQAAGVNARPVSRPTLINIVRVSAETGQRLCEADTHVSVGPKTQLDLLLQ